MLTETDDSQGIFEYVVFDCSQANRRGQRTGNDLGVLKRSGKWKGEGFKGGGEPMIAKTVRVIRELFLPDTDLRKALGLAPHVVIIEVVRKTGVYRKGGAIDLQGSLVTVFDPREV